MAYDPTIWENREVEKPRTYIMTDNGDGTITLTPSEGQVFTAGTPLDAVNLNKMEAQIELNDSDKVSKSGDTMTGQLNGTVINATTALQEAGVNLSTLYQAKGNFAPTGNYPTWAADPNGIKITMGKFNGTGKNIVLFLTTAQPAANSGEIRVWIQIDSF
jgi:hypothetical protein